MRDTDIMDCGEIQKRLKPFLEDLLSEVERRAFIVHLDGCSKCKGYVSAIDSLTNQLWKLGEVKVPADFCSTTLFKLKQAEEELRRPNLVISKKLGIRILILALMILMLFFGISYLKHRKYPKGAGDVQVISAVVERKPAISDREAKSLFEKLKEIAAMLGVLEEETVTEENSKKEDKERAWRKF